MEKFAIVVCRKRAQRCTMISCLADHRERRGQFSNHTDAEIAAVLDCGGCQDVYDAESMAKKLKRLQEENIRLIALSGCVKPTCTSWKRIISDFSEEGMEVLHCSQLENL